MNVHPTDFSNSKVSCCQLVYVQTLPTIIYIALLTVHFVLHKNNCYNIMLCHYHMNFSITTQRLFYLTRTSTYISFITLLTSFN